MHCIIAALFPIFHCAFAIPEHYHKTSDTEFSIALDSILKGFLTCTIHIVESVSRIQHAYLKTPVVLDDVTGPTKGTVQYRKRNDYLFESHYNETQPIRLRYLNCHLTVLSVLGPELGNIGSYKVATSILVKFPLWHRGKLSPFRMMLLPEFIVFLPTLDMPKELNLLTVIGQLFRAPLSHLPATFVLKWGLGQENLVNGNATAPAGFRGYFYCWYCGRNSEKFYFHCSIVKACFASMMELYSIAIGKGRNVQWGYISEKNRFHFAKTSTPGQAVNDSGRADMAKFLFHGLNETVRSSTVSHEGVAVELIPSVRNKAIGPKSYYESFELVGY